MDYSRNHNKEPDEDYSDNAVSKSDETRKTDMLRRVNKFKRLIFAKYSHLALPKLLEKAREYAKKKYDFTEEEFNEFFRLALNDKSVGVHNLYNHPDTPLARILGWTSGFPSTKMQVPTNELETIQEIFKMHADFSVLHQQIVLQSRRYVDCAPQALTGKYDSSKHNSFSFIHPVIAALFLLKIDIIESHLLHANLGNIIRHRFDGSPITTLSDYEVYWDIIVDPNEIVCISPKESSIIDLRNRVRAQYELYKVVRELREGRYYSDSFRDFLYVLDNCKNSLFESPDYTNVRDEGTILKKLFGIVGLRPTFVSISTYASSGLMTGNYSLGPMALSQVTTIPVVNVRLPINSNRNKNTAIALNLSDALEQPQWFVENRLVTQKTMSIIYSRDILVFYANRRYQSINYVRLNMPFNFSLLPATSSSLETLNDTYLGYDNILQIGDDSFMLRSVVFVERAHNDKSLILGNATGIIIPRDYSTGRTDITYLVYDPLGSGIQFEYNGTFERNPPIYSISGTTPFNNLDGVEAFDERASRRGTIFIYVKTKY